MNAEKFHPWNFSARYSAVAPALRSGKRVLIAAHGNSLRALVKYLDGVSDAAEVADLLVAAALLEQCAAFVGNDSGLGHIASAVDIPALTVFGPGEPQRYRPWNPQGAWLQSKSRAIADVSPQQAADALNALLSPREG